MEIRKARMEDAKELNSLLTLLIRDEGQYDKNINMNFEVTNMYENYINDPNRIILVALIDNKIVGYIYGFKQFKDDVFTKDIGILDALYVKEDYRTLGVANSLIKEFKKWAQEMALKEIEVNVLVANTKAHNLYLKNDFKTFSEKMKCIID